MGFCDFKDMIFVDFVLINTYICLLHFFFSYGNVYVIPLCFNLLYCLIVQPIKKFDKLGFCLCGVWSIFLISVKKKTIQNKNL